MPQMHKLSNYATTVGYKNGNTTVTYHSTPIVEFDRDAIILRTGGHKSVTTKRKMQQASNQFDLGYKIYQKDYAWFVWFKGDIIPFDTSSELVLRR